MPLARIFTRNPERTGDLSAQLKEQGYKVEVVSPDQAHLAPADLEIEFELCERADVLDRAANLATELEADIAVAPGILLPITEQKVAINAEPAVQQLIDSPAQPISQTEIHSSPVKAPEVKSDLKSDAEREFEAAFASVIPGAEMPAELASSPEVVEIPVMEHAPMPPVAILQEPSRIEAAKTMEPVRMAEQPSSIAVPVHFSESVGSEPVKAPAASLEDPAPYLAQLTPFSSPAKSDALKMKSVAQPEEKVSPAADKSKQVLEDGAKIAAKTWAGAQSLAANTAASMRDHFQEYKKRAQVRSAEARAAHAARLLDLEQRQAEAQQRAAELEAARVAASVRLKEILQQRGPGLQSLQEQSQPEQATGQIMPPSYPPMPPREKRKLEHGLWQPETGAYLQGTPQNTPAQNTASQNPLIQNTPGQNAAGAPKENPRSQVPPSAAYRATPPVPPAASASQKSGRAAIKTTPAALWQKVNPPLRAVLTGAAAVSALFIMGIALGLFHSRTPLANTADHSSATSNTAATQNEAATPQANEAAQSAAAKPQAGTKSKSGANETVAQDTNVQTAAKPSPRVQHGQQIVAQQAETQLGDDVVIRRFKQPVPTQKPKQSGQQAGLKHFSDLDN